LPSELCEVKAISPGPKTVDQASGKTVNSTEHKNSTRKIKSLTVIG